jgi:multidrug efflux pump subunit AcrA (membrane-fusion protein)
MYRNGLNNGNQMKGYQMLTERLTNNWPAIILICAGLAGFVFYQISVIDQVSDNDLAQTTATISTGDLRISAFGSGTLISAVEVEIGFEEDGIVKEILVETGDEITEGQLLLRLDDDDLQDELQEAEQKLKEMTSDAAIAAAALELAEAQKAVLTAESTLSFYISPYVFKSEIRLREAEEALQAAIQIATSNPADEADQQVVEAQEAVDNASLSLELNWETYYDEYVPDFFDFKWIDPYVEPWIDEDGKVHYYWHHYYDPPSEIEVAVVWAELAVAEARVEEAEAYLALLTEGEVPEDAAGSELTALEYAIDELVQAQEALEASRLVAPMNGIVIDIDIQELDQISAGTGLITIAQLEPITLEASFDEGDWSLVEEGNTVEVIFDSLPEKTYNGQIVFVDPSLQTSQNTTIVSTLVELDTTTKDWANLPLLSGASIEVIAGEVKDEVLLPIEGLQDDQGEIGTVLVKINDEYIQQEVELGLRDVLYVEVTEGLSPGDVVLIGTN